MTGNHTNTACVSAARCRQRTAAVNPRALSAATSISSREQWSAHFWLIPARWVQQITINHERLNWEFEIQSKNPFVFYIIPLYCVLLTYRCAAAVDQKFRVYNIKHHQLQYHLSLDAGATIINVIGIIILLTNYPNERVLSPPHHVNAIRIGIFCQLIKCDTCVPKNQSNITFWEA